MLRCALFVLAAAGATAAFLPLSTLPARTTPRTAPQHGLRGSRARLSAIIFSCDGVLVDSERDGHRIALNQAMEEAGFDKQCTVEDYGKLLGVRGEARLTK